MKMPGFTAEIVLSQTNNYYRLAAGGSFVNRETTVTRRASLDAQPAVVPAQIDSESRFLAARGGVRRPLDDRPVCPLGQKAVWVERPPTEKYCETTRPFFNMSTMRWELKTETYQCGWNPAFTGWECQSAFRVVA